MDDQPVYVTKPSLPPLEEFLPYLEKIWANKVLTNGGTFHVQLEAELCRFLQVKNLSLFSNCTIGLITALKALDIEGEVITSPYSFVATSHSILWNGLKPIFVDIDPKTFNMDPQKIEAAITSRTTAIMPVHCYGTPCDVDAIEKIAVKHSLKVVYDAAHAFGVTLNGKSILSFGDLSVVSFHATKVFNTFEGGAIIAPSLAAKLKIDQLKNFGFIDEITVLEAGINGKMSEFNSALGLVQLKHAQSVYEKRKQVDLRYRNELDDIRGIRMLSTSTEFEGNYSYFPILVDENYPISRDELYERLKYKNIFARRYFYPLISDFPMYRQLDSAQTSNLPVATMIAKQILCLPIYPDLTETQQKRVMDEIRVCSR
jgi:dTDP-4-amino-4,6-dideoxygalactose transaminase